VVFAQRPPGSLWSTGTRPDAIRWQTFVDRRLASLVIYLMLLTLIGVVLSRMWW
jgi:hypothetical protein